MGLGSMGSSSMGLRLGVGVGGGPTKLYTPLRVVKTPLTPSRDNVPLIYVLFSMPAYTY